MLRDHESRAESLSSAPLTVGRPLAVCFGGCGTAYFHGVGNSCGLSSFGIGE